MADAPETELQGVNLYHDSTGLRVAIEGCGHGTLDAIYASIYKACEVKGWDDVDLVIIGGDFQAVRDRLDLNVTAMPAKYREMADYHQYYWGNKRAPFLTIFIGGNHEASNHLYELYYGGWVAPNIYYLGAANIINVGPLKIAGMSGIWKGYDYSKPHYERLPYSQDDMYSIYHVREIDTRKLLAYRSQVDIGLSHDWPRGMEWLGNHEQLFSYKSHFKEDAQTGKLGSVAATKVLDHLRPAFWFSAHMHARYAAIKSHDTPKRPVQSTANLQHSEKANDRTPARKGNEGSSEYPHSGQPAQRQQLSAWQNFHVSARENEAKADAEFIQAQRDRQQEAERTGITVKSGNVFNETYKKVKLGDGCSRAVSSVTHNNHDQESEPSESSTALMPQLDGTCVSLPYKRRRTSSGQRHGVNIEGNDGAYAAINGNRSNIPAVNSASTANPDAIDLDMSDDDEASELAGQGSSLPPNKDHNRDVHVYEGLNAHKGIQQSPAVHPAQSGIDLRTTLENESNDALSASVPPSEQKDPATDPTPLSNGANDSAMNENTMTTDTSISNKAPEDGDVSEDMRAQLAALSAKFSVANKVETSPSLPPPETIKNQTTKFLALSKCAPGQQFLELLAMHSLDSEKLPAKRPVKIQYDPEWLAILRVFAPELTLGGSANDRIPMHRGDTYYRDRILEEEQWVQTNIVKPGLLDVPENFEVTLSNSTSETDVHDDRNMPKEQTNPQTQAFCKLIGIENKFDISEEEREARRIAGPVQQSGARQSHDRSRGGRGGRGNRGNRGGRSSRGGRGGRGGGGRGRF